MQRFQRTSPLVNLTDRVYSPEGDVFSEAANAVPSSFTDWLAQSTCPIAADAEPEQGMFVELMNQCTTQNISRPPAKIFRR